MTDQLQIEDGFAAPTDEMPGGLSGSPFALPPGKEEPSGGREYEGSGVLAGIGEKNDLSSCLQALLETLDWQGEPHEVAEALPHFVENFDITSFRNVLATLGFGSRGMTKRLNDITLEHTPCLFLPDDGAALVLVGLVESAGDNDETDDGADEYYSIETFDSTAGRYVPMPGGNPKGRVYVFTPLADEKGGEEDPDWFRAVVNKFRGLALQAFGITFLINLLGLAVPLFVMAVFDQAITTGSAGTMTYLV